MTAQPINTKIKNIIKLRSNHPASIRELKNILPELEIF